jgi:uncharacterized Ntn-hydrolase superfamily protein
MGERETRTASALCTRFSDRYLDALDVWRASLLRLFAFFAAIPLVLSLCGCQGGVSGTARQAQPVATYSIVAFDPKSGDLGVAVQSKFFGVGSVVPWAKAKVGAIATQSYANTTYGPKGLKLLEDGKRPEQVIERLTRADERREVRQVGVIDARGRAAAFTGKECLEWAGHIVGTNFAVQGNILAGEGVVRAMAETFETARQQPDSELADWLMASLAAAEKAGGDKRGRQSAALLVVRDKGGYGGLNDRFVDLRVEDHAEPIEELSRLLQLHKRFYRRVVDKKR